MHQSKCSEIWGGIKNTDVDVCSAGITASLYSSACDGGKGGDAYYFSVCGADNLTRLALADVVGHGAQVTQVSQWVYDRLAERVNDVDQAALLSELNGRVTARGFEALTTAVVMTCYLAKRHLSFSYAGHPPMFSQAGCGEWRELPLPPGERGANMPLGVTADAHYDMGETAFQKGDRLFLYSDGLLEAPNPAGEFFGRRRLRRVLQGAAYAEPMKLKAHILESLRRWTGGPLDHDDVTMIAVRLE